MTELMDVETVSEVIDDVIDGGKSLDLRVWVIASATAGAVAGAAIAYFATKNGFRTKYEKIADEEIKQAQEHYRALEASREKDVKALKSPAELLEERYDEIPETDSTAVAGLEAIAEYAGEKPPEAVVAATESVFNTPQPTRSELGAGWNYDEELARRAANPDVPYVISEEEFEQDEQEFEKGSLTYFEGDETLQDETGQAVPADRVEYLIGPEALDRFGSGTRNREMVHVRNENLEMDWEIARSKGKFSVEVLGFDDDEKNDAVRPSRRLSD